jgi:hypothetical protein
MILIGLKYQDNWKRKAEMIVETFGLIGYGSIYKVVNKLIIMKKWKKKI